MTIYQIAFRLIAFIVCCVGVCAAVSILLEYSWEWLWDHIDALRRRARHARCMADYSRMAARHGRTVKG